MRKRFISKLLCLTLVLSLLIPMVGITESFGATEEYSVKLNTTDVMSPKVISNPFEMKREETFNVGAIVVDKTGNEIGEDDFEFGDFIPTYQKMTWTPKDDGIIVNGNSANYVSITAKKVGKHLIEVSHKPIKSETIKPMTLEINVIENTGTIVKVVKRLEPGKYLDSILLGKAETITVKGFTEEGEEVKPELSIKSNTGPKYIEATAKDDQVTLKAVKEGRAFIVVKDKDGAEARLNVEAKDPSIWNFDSSKEVLLGFKNKDNPTEVVIPAEINGVAVKSIGKDAFKFGTYGGKINNQITKLTLPEGLEKTQYMSFQGNDIKEIKLPSTLTDLGERTFFGNEKLTKVEFAEGIKLQSIGVDAFYKTGLETIELPPSVKKILESSFKETPMKSITLPEGITEIGTQAFALDMFEEFTIPKTVTSLNKNSKGKEGNGIFFRNFSEKTTSSKGILRFTKVYDESGLATTLNTRGIVNPRPVTLKYVDKAGKEIKGSKVVVGYEKNKVIMVPGTYSPKPSVGEGDGHYYTDYMNPFDDVKVYSDDNFTSAIIGDNYFVKDGEYTFKAESIMGYVTPKDITKKLDGENNEIVFQYEEAEKVNLELLGKGINSDVEAGKVSAGTKVNIRVHEPDGKTLEKLLVNGKDVKGDSKYNGVDYSYSFVVEKDTTVETKFTTDDSTNKLNLTIENKKINIGEKISFLATYRGKTLKLPNDEVEITLEDANSGQIDLAKGEILPKIAGEIKINAKLVKHPEISSSAVVTVDPIEVTIRMEDDNNTVLEKTPITIDKIYLEKDKTYYMDLDFETTVPILAIEKALRGKAINTGNKDEFNCSNDANWMKVLGKNLWKNINENGSFMYMVNNKLADLGVGSYKIIPGDDIVVYYDPNWQDSSMAAFFELPESDITIKVGEASEFSLMGWIYDKLSGKLIKKPIEGASLEFKDEEGNITKTKETTDKNGYVQYIFDKGGTYMVSAVGQGNPAPFSRPYVKVTVVEPLVEYDVTVEGGKADLAKAKKGDKVTITANKAPEGKEFDKWALAEDLAQVELKDPKAMTTEFTMVEGAVKLVATYKDLPPVPNKPEIIKGADSQWKKGDIKGLEFVSDAEFEDLIKVQVDDEDLDKENYDLEKGSIKVTLKAKYLDSLKEGRHTLAIISKGGAAVTSFEILPKDEKDTTSENTGKVENKTVNKENVKASMVNNPKTGDTASKPWLLLSLAIIGLLIISYKKREKLK